MLGFIPENRTIKLFSVSKPDKFGVSVEDKVGKEHDCYFSFNTDNEKTVNPLGEEVVYTATMLFNNSENIKIKAGDKVEFTDDFEESQKKKVIKVQYKRDFAGKITSVKGSDLMAVNVRYEDNFGKFQSAMERQLKLAGEDIELDLVNAARSTAPHLYGQLERGINGELLAGGSSVKITVGASAIGSNGYDYAPKMHDGKYNLGVKSLAKGQGYSGLTGIAFPVGNNYIEAPAEQGFESYLNYFGDKYNVAVRGV